MATRNWELIANGIKAILETATTGQVHTYHRYTRTPEGFHNWFTELISAETRIINAWLIHRDSFGQMAEGVPLQHEMREHTFVIDGYYGLHDESGSELEFQNLVEDIFDALEGRKQLGVASVVEYAFPPTVPVINHAWFGQNLCHHCQIQLRVLERRVQTYVP